MKVIDLLNKIANGEEVPQKIKIGNKIYNYETFNIGKGDNYFTAEWEEAKGYRINYDGTYYYLEIRDYNLNDEVEILEEEKKITPKDFENLGYALGSIQKYINKGYNKAIEEKKIPEKLGYFDLTKDKNEKDENGDDLELHYTGVADTFDDVYEKINEIIDYLKSKGDE